MTTAAVDPVSFQATSWTSPTKSLHLTATQAFTAPQLPPLFPRDGEGVCYAGDAEGTVRFRFAFSHATAVAVVPPSTTTLDGDVDAVDTAVHPVVALQRHVDGTWCGSVRYPTGQHKVLLLVDGRPVLSPHLPITCAHNQELVNYIDVPPPDMKSCIFAMRPGTEHGSVAQDYVTSYTMDSVEDILVYLPPSYHKASSATRRYPVLYLLHNGSGEQNMVAVQHGKVNIIADNLIADGKMTEMIIVTKSSAAHFPSDVCAPDVVQQCNDVTEDIIPFIDNRYRTMADRDNRAIAGLSMGSMQASRLSITRPDLFAYAGIFSGFLRSSWSAIGTNDDHMEVLRRDPAAYQSAMKVFFRCIGDEDAHLPRFEEDDAILAELGVECTRRIYKGPHSWHVWRQAAPDFLSILFKRACK